MGTIVKAYANHYENTKEAKPNKLTETIEEPQHSENCNEN